MSSFEADILIVLVRTVLIRRRKADLQGFSKVTRSRKRHILSYKLVLEEQINQRKMFVLNEIIATTNEEGS